jgi:hypothetical protein
MINIHCSIEVALIKISVSKILMTWIGHFGGMVFLTPKGPRVFLLKIASKQPLLKASQTMQN